MRAVVLGGCESEKRQDVFVAVCRSDLSPGIVLLPIYKLLPCRIIFLNLFPVYC